MNKSKMVPALLCLLVLAWTLPALQGCITGQSAGKVMSSGAQPPIQTVENDIRALEKRITGLKNYAKEQNALGAVQATRHMQTSGYVKLDGHPTYEEVADLAYSQAAAAEAEIQQLQKQLEKMKSQRDEILGISAGCFPPESLVKMEDGTFKPFASILPGDRVLTYDIGDGRPVGKPVLEVYAVEANHLFTINDALITTAGERVLSQEGWKTVYDLKAGDQVHVDGHMVAVERIAFGRVQRTLYNMQVQDTHNFYVVTAGGEAYLVHNSGGGGGGGGGGK
jgi:hypothetical protein